jgi:hypothetical protein
VPFLESGQGSNGQKHHFGSTDRMPHMERSCTGARLIIVCGLPGSGKTTHAKLPEGRLSAIRFSPDEWMNALSLDVDVGEQPGRKPV